MINQMVTGNDKTVTNDEEPSRACARARPSSELVAVSKEYSGASSSRRRAEEASAPLIVDQLSRNAIDTLAECEHLFALAYRKEPNDWDCRDMTYYVKRGIDPEIIALAIQASAGAPRPTWRYAVAILRRCLLEGVRTLDDWDEREQRHYDMKSQKTVSKHANSGEIIPLKAQNMA